MNTANRRVGVFFIGWKLIYDDAPGVVEAFVNLIVIGAVPDDLGVGYCAVSVNDTFDLMPSTPDAKIPQYTLKLGINADGSRYHRWVKT